MPKLKTDFIDMSAERSILAGILRYGSDCYVDVSDLINSDTFHDLYNQSIFKSIEYFYKDGYNKKLDIPSIISSAHSLGIDQMVNSPDSMRRLRAISNYPIEKDTVRREAQKLFKLSLTEELDEIVAQIRRDLRTINGDEPLNHITGLAENPVFDFVGRLNQSQAEAEGPNHIATGIDEFVQNLIDNPRDNIGISSGFALYDYYIGGGFRRATVSVLGARIKQGKSVFCDNIALHVAGQLNIPCLNLDTEMTRQEHLSRILAYLCGVRSNVVVTIRDIETGRFAQNVEQLSAVHDAKEYLKTIPYDYDSVVDKSFEEQVAIMRRWVRKQVGYDKAGRTRDCLVIYDYLQPPEPGEFGESFKEYQVMGYQMLSLLRTASKCDVPIFTLVQLNRDGIDKESTAVAADSDRVLRKAANFTILKWKSDEEQAEDGPEAGTHKLVPIIARHGETMTKGDYINLKFDQKTARITELGTRNEISKNKKEKRKPKTDDSIPFQ